MTNGDSLASSWSARPLRELMRHIELQYHDCLRLELPQLIDLCAADATQDPMAAALLRSLCEAVNQDLVREEDCLFAAIRRCEEAVKGGGQLPERAAAMVRDGIPQAMRDQERLSDLFRGARERTGGPLSEQLSWLEGEFRTHNQLECEVLFERILALMRDADIGAHLV